MTNTKSLKPSKLITHHVYANLHHEGERKTIANARRFAASLRRQGFSAHIMAAYQTLDGASSYCLIVE